VSPLRGEKPQNWPLSKLNTGRFALRAMLPVITQPETSQTISQQKGLPKARKVRSLRSTLYNPSFSQKTTIA